MNAITAAVGLAQFERIETLVKRRQAVGELFLEAVSGCDWIETQEIPSHSEHGYFTFGLLYNGEVAKGVSWQKFYNRYTKMGGDGFYACWKNPYMEPSLRGMNIAGQHFELGLCPIAEEFQRKIMAFKSNYRDLDVAKKQAALLAQLINEIGPSA
jgi:dTDP-4-amino-4,6-dideoxygalactose transaminase